MKIHNLLNHRQPQPGSFPDGLCSKKWIKYLWQICCRYAGAGILHFREHHRLAMGQLAKSGFIDFQVLAELSSTRGDRKDSTLGHRLERIDEEVDEHLFDFAAIHFHWRQVRVELSHDVHLGS